MNSQMALRLPQCLAEKFASHAVAFDHTARSAAISVCSMGSVMELDPCMELMACSSSLPGPGAHGISAPRVGRASLAPCFRQPARTRREAANSFDVTGSGFGWRRRLAVRCRERGGVLSVLCHAIGPRSLAYR